MDLPKVKPVLFVGKTYSNGTHPIMVRVTIQRKHTYKSTGHSIQDEAWDKENGRVYEKRPVITKRRETELKPEKLMELKGRYKSAIVLSNAKQINSTIESLVREINSINRKLEVNEQGLNVGNIKRIISPGRTLNRSDHFFEC